MVFGPRIAASPLPVAMLRERRMVTDTEGYDRLGSAVVAVVGLLAPFAQRDGAASWPEVPVGTRPAFVPKKLKKPVRAVRASPLVQANLKLTLLSLRSNLECVRERNARREGIGGVESITNILKKEKWKEIKIIYNCIKGLHEIT